MNTIESSDFVKHPCFNPAAKKKYGRVHLPVAPKCNIKCNFCDRKYDCVNESRPGVTSTILKPAQAEVYMEKVVEMEPRITVAGIAGPGDPFANGIETISTLKLIRRKFPEMLLCVSSNGMDIMPYIEDLAEIKVSHVTITVCAVDPEIGAKIYSWVRDNKIIYRGLQAANLLLSRQLAAIKKLKEHNITVKVNCIVIPGINDHHIEEVAKTMKSLGVDLLNCMAMFPNVNTPFADIPQPSKEEMSEIRNMAESYLPQMKHCTRCRADAVGILDDDKSDEFRSCLSSCSTIPALPAEDRRYVAVASKEGLLVNQHLGEASKFHLWEKEEDGSFKMVESRKSVDRGGGPQRWHQLTKILGDCRAVLCSGVGDTPREILQKRGIKVVEAAGLIEEALPIIFDNKKLSIAKGRKITPKKQCTGTGGGCL